MTETITLTTTDWTKIEFNQTDSDAGFSFWTDADVQFSEIPAPTLTQQVPLVSGKRALFKKPIIFWVSGAIGTNIYLSPFEK